MTHGKILRTKLKTEVQNRIFYQIPVRTLPNYLSQHRLRCRKHGTRNGYDSGHNSLIKRNGTYTCSYKHLHAFKNRGTVQVKQDINLKGFC